MGSRRIAGHGGGATPLARHSLRHPAKWIFHWLSAGGGFGAFRASALGMASDVLDWRRSRATGSLYSRARSRVGSLARTPRSQRIRHPEDRRRLLEELWLSDRAHDLDDVPLAWNSGPLSRLHEDHTRHLSGDGFLCRHALQRRGSFGGHGLWTSLRNSGQALQHDRRAGAFDGGNSPLGIRSFAELAGVGSVSDADGRPGRLGNHSGAP